MKRITRNRILLVAVFTFVVTSFLLSVYGKGSVAAQVVGIDVLYTNDADFDQGTLVSVNHDAPFNDQLQLDSPIEPFPFINVAASGRGTVVRSNTETGEIVGEYRTAPEGRGLNPSRTTVDLFGNVWTANRNEEDEIDGVRHGSAVKIGLIVGGSRVEGDGTPNPSGDYLAPPFGYNTCVDRDGDGLIRTSKGLADILDWPDITDGVGGADGLVQDAEDECILIFQRLYDAENTRHVSVDADNNVWVGGYPFALRMFYKLDGTDGSIIDSFDARDIGCGGYGGLVDGHGILWSVGGDLLRYDPVTRSGTCIEENGYGLGIDTNGYIWMSIWDGGIVKIAPDGTVEPGFPKPTYPSSSTTTTAFSGTAIASNASRLLAVSPRNQISAPAAPLVAGDPSVTFQVAPVDDWIRSTSPWTAGATISMTIEDGGVEVYSGSITADSGGNFYFGLQDTFDVQRGQIVTVSDGITTKTHTVANLYVDTIDVSADTMSGRADGDADVDIWVHGDGGLTVTADSSGNWTADFSGTTDLTFLSDGGSQQFDDDGDSTGVWWASPRFQLAPEDDWVQSWSQWTPDATISLTIEDGSGVIYAASQTADSDGNFQFNLWEDEFDLARGHAVTVSDGATTKTHTVTDLFVDGVNVTADTVFGRAVAGSSVDVDVHDYGGLTVTADGSGEWIADFSGLTDLTFHTEGSAKQMDDDGDATGVWWAAPRFQVSPDDDHVQNWSRWSPGATIFLSIEDGSGVLFTDSQTADDQGNFNFNLREQFDIERGHVVSVSDGTTTKTHTVTNLFVTNVDVTADTVSGRADDGSSVDVNVHDDGEMTVTADGAGDWMADFSGSTDLTFHTEGSAKQVDAEGDATAIWWSSPKIEVAPDDDWVQSWSRWTPGATISLTIENGSDVLYSDTQTADSGGNFHFNFGDVFDLQRGHVVTISDGTTTKTHTVFDLFVDGFDVTADTVFGRADAGTDVEVWVHDDGNLDVTAGGDGHWVADFSGMTDLTYGSDGGSRQVDDDGDTTGVWWQGPRIEVAPEDDWVQSWSRWTPGATISLTIEDGSDEVYSDSTTADSDGNFYFDLWDSFDLQRGHIVTVSDGTFTKIHTVTNLYVDGVDVVANTVFGRAEAGTEVEIWVHDDGNLSVTADGDGNWIADFSGMTDLTYLSDGGSRQVDEDGDTTGVWWSSPNFEVSPGENWVRSWNRWTPGAEIEVMIESSSAPIIKTVDADSGGNFHIDIWEIDLETDHVVTVTDGSATKNHTITAVDVTDIDTDADLVRGTAGPGAQVRVQASLFDDGSERWVTAGSGGNWTADFSVATDDGPAYDITDFTRIDVNEFDDESDSTYRRFGPPLQQNRGVAVTPKDNHVWVANSYVDTVTRLDNDGNVLKVIETGQAPSGVAVDAAGKVWATNMGWMSNNIVRIDPNGEPDGLGIVDLTVELGDGANPYNYSDMTGAVVVGSTSPQGLWAVIQDSGTPGFHWGRIIWNSEPEGNVPPGSEIVVEVRTADTEAGLGGLPFTEVDNGLLFSSFGRYIEVRVTLKASPEGLSPVLSDIRVQPHVIPVEIDIKPGSDPNSINCQNVKEVITVAVLTTGDFDALTVDHSTVTFEGASETHVIKRSGEPRRHEEDVDNDGDMDLVFHFRQGDTNLTCDSTEGTLVGEIFDGIPIEGTDAVRMVNIE